MEEQQMIKELFIITNKLKRLLDKKHSKNGLYVGQARVLMYLYRHKDEKTYQKDIEQAFQIRGGTVTGLIDSLVENQYIKRIESENDKRKRKIVLTNKGEQMALKSIQTTKNTEESLSDQLLEKEKETLKKVIKKINTWVDKEEENEKNI